MEWWELKKPSHLGQLKIPDEASLSVWWWIVCLRILLSLVVASGSKSSIIYITLDKSVLIPKPELRGFGDISLTKPPFKVTSAGWSLEFVHIKIPLCTRGFLKTPWTTNHPEKIKATSLDDVGWIQVVEKDWFQQKKVPSSKGDAIYKYSSTGYKVGPKKTVINGLPYKWRNIYNWVCLGFFTLL